MYKRLTEFLDKHNILIENQFGFRSGHSTTQATMLITDKIQRAIEANYTLVVYFWTEVKPLIQ